MTSETKSASVIPFGKYKGQPVDTLLADHPYMEWLCAQPWFRANFAVLHQTIINHGAEPQDTPDHNAMQVKFLDDAYCVAFVRSLRHFEMATRGLERHRLTEIEDLKKEISDKEHEQEREVEGETHNLCTSTRARARHYWGHNEFSDQYARARGILGPALRGPALSWPHQSEEAAWSRKRSGMNYGATTKRWTECSTLRLGMQKGQKRTRTARATLNAFKGFGNG